MNIIQKYRTNWVPQYLLENTENFMGKQREYIENYGYQFSFEFYSPHFTLAGNDMDEDTFKKVQRELENKSFEISFNVSKFTLIDREVKNRTVREFVLKG